jgi:peptidoglycan/LPS O-acetylase OafA/YrhL
MAVIAPGSPFQVIPKPTFGDIVAGLLMIRTWGNTVFWTLLIELRWYCLLPLVVAALKWVDTTFSKRFLSASVVLGLSVVVAYVYDRFGLHIDGVPGKLLFVIGPIPLYLPVLVSGVVIAQLHSELGKAKSLIKVIGTLAGIVLFVYSLTQFPQDPTTFSPMKRLLFSGLVATVMFASDVCKVWRSFLHGVFDSSTHHSHFSTSLAKRIDVHQSRRIHLLRCSSSGFSAIEFPCSCND